MKTLLRQLLLGAGLLIFGGLLGSMWQGIIVRSFASTGAQLMATDPSAGVRDLALFTAVVVAAGPLALGLQRILVAATRRPQRPLWILLGALLIGVNLGITLRLAALATNTIPEAIRTAASEGIAVVLDTSSAPIAPWALGGLLGAAVVSLGVLTTMGLISEDKSDT